MRKGLSIFWILYILFFAIPFPMLLYYNIKSDNMPNLTKTDPWFALGLVALSMLLWIILLIGYYRKWVIRTFSIKRNIEKLKSTGEHREAKIIAAAKVSKPNAAYDAYELTLQFKNLAGSEIRQKATINDSKPYERRYEVGRTVGILLDKEVNKVPYFIIASIEASINKSTIALVNLGWFAVACIVAGYFVYSYSLESEGMGWRFMSLGHPLLVCPAELLFYRFVDAIILSKFRGKPNESFLIKFKGTRTTARLIKVSQTGAYINFELEFTDQHNQKHKANLKKIVNLFDLDVTKQEDISIFYLKENPQKIAFEKDLNEINGES
jgi:hypothetical protein